MKLSPEAESIAQDITDILNKFKTPLERWELMQYPLVNAYFKGLGRRPHNFQDGTTHKKLEDILLYLSDIKDTQQFFNIDTKEERDVFTLLSITYFIGLTNKNMSIMPDDSLREKVYLQLQYDKQQNFKINLVNPG